MKKTLPKLLKPIFVLSSLLLITFSSKAQLQDSISVDTTAIAKTKEPNKRPYTFHDSLDHQFDISDWMINAKGFLPVAGIVTESAVGGFGGFVAPVFMKKKPPVEEKGKMYPVSPDMTFAGGMYTLNNSWGVLAGRVAEIEKLKLRYKIFAGYGDMNLSYYHSFPKLGLTDQELEFNQQAIPIYLYLGHSLFNHHWYLGLQWVLLHDKISYKNNIDISTDIVPEPIQEEVKEYIQELKDKNNLGTLFLSIPGLHLEFDNRDNTFTPDKGMKAAVIGIWSNSIFGSDFDFERVEYSLLWYKPIKHNWISGLRFDAEQAFGDIPFFMLPYISMRGVSDFRYQGKNVALLETEQRWDFVPRWSAVAFAGGGKPFDSISSFGESNWVYSYGAGFRYLLARKFKIRCGVDIAYGNEGQFTYYIIFGSNWR